MSSPRPAERPEGVAADEPRQAAAVLPPFDAVVLAGGRARRMGGLDKPGLDLAGRSLAARVSDAAHRAGRVVLVGPSRPGVRADVTTREEPPGAGPVAALGAGIAHVTAPTVAVLAGDLPFVTDGDVDTLRAALHEDPSAEVVVAEDADGRDQWLLACWRTDALRRALIAAGTLADMSLKRLYAGSAVRRVRLEARPDRPPWFDVDTPEDAATARDRAGGPGDPAREHAADPARRRSHDTRGHA